MTLLAPYRVLDLSDERGQLAGFLLAQLGADVIAVEPPAAVERERSPSEAAYQRGKRSIALDLAGSAEHRSMLDDLLSRTDVLLTTGGSTELAAIGIEPSALQRRHPHLVHAAVSAFGLTGPKADYLATDIVTLAAGGLLWLSGDEDRPPVRPCVPQGFANAAVDAVGAALIGLWERSRSGLGQLIDVAAQASLLQTTQCAVLAEALGAEPATRHASGYTMQGLDIKMVWECKDGYVSISFQFGPAVGPFTTRLMQWVQEEGLLDDDLVDTDWIRFSAQVAEGTETVDKYERIKACLARFLRRKTRAELLDAALQRRLVVAPITAIDDVANSAQLRARSYWDEVDGTRYCGAVAKFSATPLPRLGGAPPVDADADHVRRESRSAELRTTGVVDTAHGSSGHRTLEGMRVLDFTWAIAGPAATRVLADHGATVVRIESSHKPEAGRFLPPFVNNVIDTENSSVFLNMNVGKLGMAIDLNHPSSRDVIHDLVRWADVVCETFTPGTMGRWGLGYEELRDINPSIVMLSSALMGQTGPLAGFAGYGNLSSSMCGFYNITGWPDREPTGPYIAYTDYVAPRFTVAVLMAALDHRRRTGEGQYIDFSHAEASMHLLAPAFMQYFSTGAVATRNGNRDEHFAPHGVYPCAGEDRWIAIAIDSDDTWAAFCRASGFAQDLAMLDVTARREIADELDSLIAEWSKSKDRDELEHQLQAFGVPAHGVHASIDSLNDPQLRHRRHFAHADHQVHGSLTIEGTRWTASRGSPTSYRAAPTMGQDTFQILDEIVGYDPGADRRALRVRRAGLNVEVAELPA